MSKSQIWVWCGEDATKHDVNNWHMLRKLLELNTRNGDYIIEFMCRDEQMEFETQLKNKGWQLDVAATENTPNLNCWQRELAFTEA